MKWNVKSIILRLVLASGPVPVSWIFDEVRNQVIGFARKPLFDQTVEIEKALNELVCAKKIRMEICEYVITFSPA